MVRFGTWIGSFFVYRPPQFGFRPASSACCSLLWEVEQTRTSPKRSRSPFLRWRRPGLIPDQVPEELTLEGGKEKKQRLLAYLREHPEELRPASL